MTTEHICPTCGPTRSEQHPRRTNVTRCANCKEWLDAGGAEGYIVEVKPSTGEATFTSIEFTGAFSSLRHDERTGLMDAYKRTAAEGYAVLFRCVAQIIAERGAEK